jgi:hypothetical protein
MDIHLIGYDTEEHANEIGALVSECLTAVASELDLSLDDLDGITVAHDYARALAELDRGFAASQPLAPTSDLAVGIAMTPAVLRDGCVKAHIVLHAGIPESLKSEDEAMVQLSAGRDISREIFGSPHVRNELVSGERQRVFTVYKKGGQHNRSTLHRNISTDLGFRHLAVNSISLV